MLSLLLLSWQARATATNCFERDLMQYSSGVEVCPAAPAALSESGTLLVLLPWA